MLNTLILPLLFLILYLLKKISHAIWATLPKPDRIINLTGRVGTYNFY